MELPFSRDEFLDVFAAYNTGLWPAALVLWLATVLVVRAHIRDRDRSVWICGVLIAQWAWAAIVYHAALFSRVNPAAWLFAVLFLIEAFLLTWHGIAHHRLRFSTENRISRMTGYGLVVYGLVYPLLALGGTEGYPRIPTFGVPCSTTIVTIGFLMLATPPLPVALTIVPILWAVIGGSAAFLLEMRADLVLFVAACALALRVRSTTRPTVSVAA